MRQQRQAKRRQQRSQNSGIPAIAHDLEKMMVRCAKVMNLCFSGWDFKLDQAGIFWLLEVNPMPGYHVYDRHADGRISKALVNEMMGIAL